MLSETKPSINHFPQAGRRQIVKDSAKYVGASIIAQGVGLAKSIAIPLLFSPAQLGIWNLMGVIMGYGANATFGIQDGMNKAIPFLRAQDKLEQSEAIKDSVFWMNLLLGALAGFSLWIGSLIAPGSYVSGLRIISVTVFFQLIFYYLFSLLRADSRFGLLSQGVAGLSILSTAFIVCLAVAFSDRLVGALVGLSIAYMLIVAYWFGRGQYKFAFRVNWGSIREALTLGFPLAILGFLSSIFLSIDRWIIATNLGEANLGYYALGIMGSNLLGLVPGSVASVLYPRMIEGFGAAQDPRGASRLLLNPLRAIAAIMLILICIATLGLPLLIQLFLPKYLPSVPMIEILVPGAFFLCIAPIAGNYMVAVNKQGWLMKVLIVTIIFTFLLDSLLLRAGYGVLGIAVGTVAGYSIYGVGYTMLAVYVALGRKDEVVRFVMCLVFPFIVMVLAMAVAGSIIAEGLTPIGYLWSTVGKLAVVTSTVLVSLWAVNRDGELIAVARVEIQGWLAERRGGS